MVLCWGGELFVYEVLRRGGDGDGADGTSVGMRTGGTWAGRGNFWV